MISRNSVRPATLDALLPQVAEGLLGQRRQVAGVGPGTQGSWEWSHRAVLLEGFLNQAARLAGDLIQGRVLHGVLKALEGQRLPFALHALLDLLVAELQQQFVQRDADRARLPAGAAQARGVGKVLRVLLPLEKRGYNRSYRAGVGRAIGVAAR